MQRRLFSQSLLSAAVLPGAAALVAPVQAHAEEAQVFTEGKHYRVLKSPVPTDVAAGKIEVLEFFSYGCPHCFHFEPPMGKWKAQLSDDVEVRRIHVAFNKSFVPWQQMYYSLEAMNLVDQLHYKFFQVLHVERKRLADANSMADWVASQGVDREKFVAVFNSFGVAGKVKRAVQIQDAYQVEGTPAVTVAGRFYVPGQGPRTLEIASQLIAQVRKG